MEKIVPEKFWHRTFEIGIALKALNGVLEIVAGVLLFFIKPATINALITKLAESELIEDVHDAVANFLVQSGQHLSSGTLVFTIIFLLSHGIIKVFLVFSLWKNKLWAYPLAMFIFGAFCVYQLYRYSFTHSIGMIVLTVLDIFVIVLTWHEYNYVKKNQAG